MSKRTLILIKTLVHLACLAPALWLFFFYLSGGLERESDPVATITHFTGNCALWILLATLAITPIRRVSPRTGWLIRLRRLIGLYSFFYASLHLATYIFLFSGYDLPTVFAGIRSGKPRIVLDQWRLIWPSIQDDVRKRSFIPPGFVAWLILFALALTSPASAIRAMGGKNWRRLHQFVYGAAIAAVVHNWWMTKPGAHTPWRVTVVFVLVLLARILSKRLSKPREFEVRRVSR